jgi:hypothetical protein
MATTTERGWAFGIMKRQGLAWMLALLALGGASARSVADDGSVLGKVVQMSSERGRYTFQFAQDDGGPDLMPGCRKLEIEVRYTYRPQNWLPFVHSEYPSKKQTEKVVTFLKRVLREGREIFFGPVGEGFAPVPGETCSFVSHALALEYRGERELVLSYSTARRQPLVAPNNND